MSVAGFPPLYDQWTQASYEVRVRSAAIYLWGSAGLKKDLNFDKPLLLHVRNDVFGKPVELSTRVASGAVTVLGTLAPGEVVTLPVQDITGIFATCQAESTVACLVRSAA